MKQKEKIIGDFTYQVTQLDAFSAIAIQTKLIKILGSSASSLDLISLVQGGNVTKDKMENLLVGAIPHLLENFDDKSVNELLFSLFERNVYTKTPEGASLKVDPSTHFIGRLGDMWKVAGFILEVNLSLGELSGSSLPTTEKENLTQEN